MDEISISIPLSAVKTMPQALREAMLAYLAQALGLNSASTVDTLSLSGQEEGGLAKLDVLEAKLFLNKCSDKTITILQFIVDHDGDFMSSAVAEHVGTSMAELRGAWAGLTKRVRTITKTDDASLINWFRQGDDWHGVVAAQTVVSMRIALAERA